MKKIILLLLIIVFAGTQQIVSAAACNVTNLVFRINSFTPLQGGGCSYNIDIGFDIEHNGGNKYIYAHLWQSANYPSWGGIFTSAPATATLNASNPIGTFQINIGTTDMLSTVYIMGGVTTMLTGTLTKTTVGQFDRYLISNVSISFISCPSLLTIKADVWASQSGNGRIVHCINGGLEFILPSSNFNLTSLYFCDDLNTSGPVNRQYNIQMNSTNTTANALSVSYKVYVDNGNGTFLISEEILAASFLGITLDISNSYNGGRVEYLPYSVTAPYMNNDVWIQANVISPIGTFNELRRMPNSCIPVAVKFSSFTAKRTNSNNVNLVWQTSSEINNRGFEVQRNINGYWEPVYFINSQATNGNSHNLLTYTFNDLNNFKGITQYRIRQVDIEGNSELSSVRAVRGESVSSKTIIYPNPSTDGSVKVLFEDKSTLRNIVLFDLNGRVVRKWNNINETPLLIEKLNTGIYNLRIIDQNTRIQEFKKIVIVNK